MYESIKEQRKKFIEGLKADVSKYKENILSDEKAKSALDAEKIEKDWDQVGADIKNSIATSIYEDLVKGLSSNIKSATKKQYENEK